MPPLLAATIILAFSGNIASSNHTLTLVNWLLSLMPSWTQISPERLNGCLRKGWHVLIYLTLYLTCPPKTDPHVKLEWWIKGRQGDG